MQHFLSQILRRNTAPPPPVQTQIDVPADTLQRLHDQGLLLAFASETGFIDDMADTTARDLKAVGIKTRPAELNEVNHKTLAQEDIVLFMTSTTGSGDAPFAADRFWADVIAQTADLSHLTYALLSAGDSDYDEFCGFGRELRDWLQASGAQSLFEPIDIDCEDEAAIEYWRRHIKHAFAREPVNA